MTIDTRLQVKLAQLLAEHHGKCRRDSCTNAHAYDLNPLAEAILRCPDLWVEIVEPEHTVHSVYEKCPGEYNCERPLMQIIAVMDKRGRTVGRFYELKQARDYADWLNSKESK